MSEGLAVSLVGWLVGLLHLLGFLVLGLWGVDLEMRKPHAV